MIRGFNNWVFFTFSLLLFSCSQGTFNLEREGGVRFTLEVDAVDFLKKESGNTHDTVFLQALGEISQMKTGNRDRILALVNRFYASANLASVFSRVHPEKYRADITPEALHSKLVQEYDHTSGAVQHILAARLNAFGVDGADLHIYRGKTQAIVIEIAKGYELQRLRKLLQVNARLGFYETYENAEVFPYLEKVNTELSKELYPGSDTMVLDELPKQSPLFNYLQPHIQRDEKGYYSFIPGCCIGRCRPADTAALNRLLRMETTRLVLPHDLYLLWAFKTEQYDGLAQGSNHNNTGANRVLNLYAIKANDIAIPALNGQVITQAYEEEDAASGRMQVNLAMDAEGAQSWKSITEGNIRRSIAMVLDGYVLSAPVVETAIPNGQSVIAGNFTHEEVREMAILLRSKALPVRTSITTEVQIAPRN